MPHDSGCFSRGRLAFYGWFALCVACSAPDSSGLFEVLPARAAGSSGAANGGSAGATSAAGGSAGGAGGNAAPSEGQGGRLPLVEAGGAGSGGSDVGPLEGVDASAPDAGAFDAGVVDEEEDAAPPPIPCEPRAERCDGVDNDCDGLVDEGQTCPDDCSGFTLEGHGYMFCPEPLDRQFALARCAAEGMKLAWLETPVENAALVSSIAELDDNGGVELVVQIGASDEDDEDDWFWIGNGAALDGFQFWEGNTADDNDAGPVGGAYENWGDGEPNDSAGEDCGIMSVTGSANRAAGEWDDRDCAVEFPFVCETP